MTLTWSDNSSDEEWFDLERWNGSNWSRIVRTGAGTTRYTEGGLSQDVTYQYRVRAGNSAGPSDYSNTASTTTPRSDSAGTQPAPPSSLAAYGASASQIDLHWSDNSTNESGFRVERATPSSWVYVASVPAGTTTYADQGLEQGRSYSYRVAAYNAAGESYSNTATGHTYSDTSGSTSPSPTPSASPKVYYYDDEEGASAEECWGGCQVEHRVRWMKVSQQHSDVGLDSEFQFKNGRETVSGVGFKWAGKNWAASGTSTEAVSRGTFAGKPLHGNAKHRVVQAKYKWVKWKVTTHCDADGVQRCTYYKWKNHRWEDELRFADEHPGAADFETNRENAVPLQQGETWGRYTGENRTFAAGVDIGPLVLKSQAGFSSISSLTFHAKGPCDAKTKTRWPYGDGVHARDAKVVYAFSYCLP